MSRLTIIAVLLAAAPAGAQGLEGTGRISLVAGWRYTPNDHFARSAQEAGFPLARASAGGPQGTGTFAYAASDALEVAIDLFAGYEALDLTNADDLSSVSYGALLGVRAYWVLGPLRPNIGLGLGPALIYTQGGPAGHLVERLVTAYAATAGFTWRLSNTLGLHVDVRYLLARGMAEDIGGVNAGGLWGGVGVTWYFAGEPSRPGAVR